MGCSNTPYPSVEEGGPVTLYSSFENPPKDLDPQRTYTVADGQLNAFVYERLLAYDYLKRPLELIPELAKEVPKPIIKRDAEGEILEVRYSFTLHQGVKFTDDPCFSHGLGRELKASDFVFAFKRLADADTNCPVRDSFSHILGFADYGDRVAELKEQRGDQVGSIRSLYEEAGNIEGIQLTGLYSFDLVMDHAYPQILYWLAMRFVPAMPYEAVEYYDGEKHEGELEVRPGFDEHPVGTGAYVFHWPEFNRSAKWVFEKNEDWWGYHAPSPKIPQTVFPQQPGGEFDEAEGFWSLERAGRPLGQIERIEFYYEKEVLSRFSKFLQGYYDSAGIPVESFDQVISNDELTPEIEEKGIRLIKDIGLDVFYIGFNMQDDEIGSPQQFTDPAKEAQRAKYLKRNRHIRQAMSLALDIEEYLRIFNNKLGVVAQSPLPPGMFGFDENYKNPSRVFDPELKKAKALLAEVGMEGGIDPDTGAPFTLTYDVGSADSRQRVRYNFYIDAWKKLGIDVQLAATDYNKFQKKMHAGSFQIFQWGWIADYPDPENFLFLLYGPNSGKYGERKPNHAWWESDEYDFLFKKMENLTNEQSTSWNDSKSGEAVTMSRLEIINRMKDLLAEECPWIPLLHRESYGLIHSWLAYNKPQPITGSYQRFYELDAEKRATLREAWNKPMVWPAYVLVIATVLFLLPGYLSFKKERR